MDTIWIIEDWAGNRMFPDQTFETQEDGFAFVQERFDDDELEDIYVVPQK